VPGYRCRRASLPAQRRDISGRGAHGVLARPYSLLGGGQAVQPGCVADTCCRRRSCRRAPRNGQPSLLGRAGVRRGGRRGIVSPLAVRLRGGCSRSLDSGVPGRTGSLPLPHRLAGTVLGGSVLASVYPLLPDLRQRALHARVLGGRLPHTRLSSPPGSHTPGARRGVQRNRPGSDTARTWLTGAGVGTPRGSHTAPPGPECICGPSIRTWCCSGRSVGARSLSGSDPAIAVRCPMLGHADGGGNHWCGEGTPRPCSQSASEMGRGCASSAGGYNRIRVVAVPARSADAASSPGAEVTVAGR
jgi:hypothetical protein